MAWHEDIEEALGAWPCDVESITPLAGGWNSTTWLVSASGGRFVAKLVDQPEAEALISGLRLAESAAARGLPCGPPVRTRRGELTVLLPGGALALLEYQAGTRPDLAVAEEVQRAGRVMARAHDVLRDCPAGDDPRYRWPWDWVPRCLDTIPMAAHVTAAARLAWDEIVRTVDEHHLSISLIHADPSPEAFLLNGADAGRDAIIDWATTLRGPLLYDLASFAVTTSAAGPRALQWFIAGYMQVMPQIGPELAQLACLIRARWLANAIYFSSRIARDITRGSDYPTANKDGLAAAYRGMTAPQNAAAAAELSRS